MIIDIERDPRHAFQIRRYHTWGVHRQQSVGEHTAQVMRIMVTIDAELSSQKLLTYALLHDVGEMAGDVPWPGKRRFPEVKSSMDKAEEHVRSEMTAHWGQPRLPALTAVERHFFKMCESIEMWEYALQEVNLGNRYAVIIATRMLLQACELMGYLPRETQAEAKRYVRLRQEQESETELVTSADPRHTGHSDPAEESMQHVDKEERK